MVQQDPPAFKDLKVIQALPDQQVRMVPMEELDPKVQRAFKAMWDRRGQKVRQVLKALKE